MEIDVYLFFDGSCEEAFATYAKLFGGTQSALMRYGDAADGPPSYIGSRRILHTTIRVGGRSLMGSDSPPPGTPGAGHGYEKPQGFRASLGVPTPADAERIFAGLAEGGHVEVALMETFFAHRFGMLTDRFGTPWMVTCSKDQGTGTAPKAPARKRRKA